MRKLWSLCVVFGMMLGSWSVVAAETYSFSYLQGMPWIPLKVAKANGFWKKQGTNVRLIEYATPGDAVRAAMRRRIDLALVPMPAIATFRNSFAPDATYLGTLSLPVYGKSLIIKKRLRQKSLQGETVGTYTDDVGNKFFLNHYLQKVNTCLEDIHLVEMGPNDLQANFMKDRLAVVLAFASEDEPFYEKADGMLAASTRTIYEPHGLCALKQGGLPQKDLKNILRGCIEAIEWMRNPENWEEYRALLIRELFPERPNLSDNELRALTREEEFVAPAILLEHNQHRLTNYFSEFRAFLVEKRIMPPPVLKNFTLDNVLYTQTLIEVLQEYTE